MKLKFIMFSTACLSFFMVPAAGTNLLAASNGVVIGGLAGVSGGHHVVIHTKPPQHVPQVVLEHKPVTLVPVATIPSYSLTDKLSKLWGGISDSISTKIQAVGGFFHGPPKVVYINVGTTPKPTTTKKPTPHQPPVIVEIVGVPHHRVYPMQVPVMVGCGNEMKCNY